MFSLQSVVTPAWTEDLLRRSLLAKEIIDVHLHLFSSRSKSSKRVLRPRMLNSNTRLLKSSAKYFADLFSSETMLSNSKTVLVETGDAIFDGLPLDEYGYESDSDLEDEQDESDDEDDDEDEDDDGYEPSHDVKQNPGAVSGPNCKKLDMKIAQARATSSQSHKGCHIFVKDTAFQTWYCLVYYLYTGVMTFAPLKSSGARKSSASDYLNADTKPQCSAKSMYALATKLGLNQLREQAFNFIRQNVNEKNLLQELACSFVGRHPDVLEFELDLLAEKYATVPIIQGLPQLMTRIAKNELDHGAKILNGHHARILQKYSLSAPPLPTATSLSVQSTSSSQRVLAPLPGAPPLFSSPSAAASAPAPVPFSFSATKTNSTSSNPGKSK